MPHTEFELLFTAAVEEVQTVDDAERILRFLSGRNYRSAKQIYHPKSPENLARIICQGEGNLDLLKGFEFLYDTPICISYEGDTWIKSFMIGYERIYGGQMSLRQRKVLYSKHLPNSLGWMKYSPADDFVAGWEEWWLPRLQQSPNLPQAVLQMLAINGVSLTDSHYLVYKLKDQLGCISLTVDLLQKALIPALLPVFDEEHAVYRLWSTEHYKKAKSIWKPLITIIRSPLPIADLMRFFAPHLALSASIPQDADPLATWLQLLIPEAPVLTMPDSRYQELLEWIINYECDEEIVEIIWNTLLGYSRFVDLAIEILQRQTEEKLESLVTGYTRSSNLEALVKALVKCSFSKHFFQEVLWTFVWSLAELDNHWRPLPSLIEKLMGEGDLRPTRDVIDSLLFQKALQEILPSSSYKQKLFQLVDSNGKLAYLSKLTDPSELMWILPTLESKSIGPVSLQSSLSQSLCLEHLPPGHAQINLEILWILMYVSGYHDLSRLAILFGRMLLEFVRTDWNSSLLPVYFCCLLNIYLEGIPANSTWDDLDKEIEEKHHSLDHSIISMWSEFKAKIFPE